MQACFNISHMCETGNRSIEVIQGPFYTRNSLDFFLGVSSDAQPGIASSTTYSWSVPMTPTKARVLAFSLNEKVAASVSHAHVSLCQSKRETSYRRALFIE